jgi:ferredoxin--NADP+ reductase
MYEILGTEELTPVTKLFEIRAPAVARKAQAGQFVILRIHEQGERIPLTIADYDRGQGTISLVVQEVGKTTLEMGTMHAGDHLSSLAGPLGLPSEIESYGTVVCIGGGFAIAPIPSPSI